jgi:hypothetical protein
MKKQKVVPTPRPDGYRKALKAGPHGKQTNADGTSHATPSKHGKKNLAKIG